MPPKPRKNRTPSPRGRKRAPTMTSPKDKSLPKKACATVPRLDQDEEIPQPSRALRVRVAKEKMRTKEKEEGCREKQLQQEGDEGEGVEQPRLRRSARMSKGKVVDEVESGEDNGGEESEEDGDKGEGEGEASRRSVNQVVKEK